MKNGEIISIREVPLEDLFPEIQRGSHVDKLNIEIKRLQEELKRLDSLLTEARIERNEARARAKYWQNAFESMSIDNPFYYED